MSEVLYAFHAVQIWQAPTSKRMKVKLTVQKEVMNGAIMQQSMIVDFIVSPTDLVRVLQGFLSRSPGSSVMTVNEPTLRTLGTLRYKGARPAYH